MKASITVSDSLRARSSFLLALHVARGVVFDSCSQSGADPLCNELGEGFSVLGLGDTPQIPPLQRPGRTHQRQNVFKYSSVDYVEHATVYAAFENFREYAKVTSFFFEYLRKVAGGFHDSRFLIKQNYPLF